MLKFILLLLSTVVAATPAFSQPATTPQAETEGIRIKSKPPPGFEVLLEPQTTLVDVYYGGTQIVSTLAVYTPSEIELLDPKAIVDLIPGVLDRERVLGALTGPLPAHAELICPPQPYPGCGVLQPDVAGVIFDVDRFRLDVFVNAALLETRLTITDKYLPPSDADAALLQQFNASYSRVDDGASSSNLRGDTTLSFGSKRLQSLWSYSDDDFVLETLSAVRDERDWQYSAGMFRTTGFRMVGEQDVAGVAAVTSTATRIDLAEAFGSTLQVFLPLRSQVDILKDGRLISSRFYEAGNQVLDTTALPDGAYTISLRIRDVRGVVEEQTRFYAKTAEIPPFDQPTYIAQAGLLRDKDALQSTPEYTDTWLVRLGTAYRITDTLGWDAGALAGDDELVLEAGTTWLTPQVRVRGGLMGTAAKDYGLSADARFEEYRRLSGGMSLRLVWRGDSPAAEDDFDPVTASSAQFSGLATYRTDRIAYNLRANWQRRNDEESSWSVTPSISVRLLRRGGIQLDFNVQYTETNRGSEALGQIKLRTWQGRWNANGRLGARTFKTDSTQDGLQNDGGMIGAGRLSWSDGESLPEQDLTLSVAGETELERDTVAGSMDYQRREGRVQATAERTWNAVDGRQTAYGANLSFGIASDGQSLAIGGAQLGQSTLVIHFTGTAREGLFDVLVNDQKRGTARIGEKTLLFLPAYRTYQVQLRPLNTGFIHYDASERRVTLYPGNVMTMPWKVDEVYVAFARILRPDGSPVAHALVRGAIGLALTEDNGLLQAELAAGTRTLTLAPRAGEACQVELPELRPEQGVVMLSELQCR